MTPPTPSPHPTARVGSHRTRTLVLVGIAAALVAGMNTLDVERTNEGLEALEKTCANA